MATKTVAVFLLLSSLFYITQAHPFKLSNCDTTSPVQLNVNQFPSPFLIKDNATFILSAGVKVNRKLPNDIYVKISISKKIGFWIRVPCIGCDFEVDCKKTPAFCTVRDLCAGCSLNMHDVEIKLPSNIEEKIPSFIPDFVINGDYWAKIEVVDAKKRDSRIACIEVYANIKNY